MKRPTLGSRVFAFTFATLAVSGPLPVRYAIGVVVLVLVMLALMGPTGSDR